MSSSRDQRQRQEGSATGHFDFKTYYDAQDHKTNDQKARDKFHSKCDTDNSAFGRAAANVSGRREAKIEEGRDEARQDFAQINKAYGQDNGDQKSMGKKDQKTTGNKAKGKVKEVIASCPTQ